MRGDCDMIQISAMYGIQVRSSMEYSVRTATYCIWNLLTGSDTHAYN